MSDPELIDVQEVAPAEVAEVDLYQRREKIYTRKIEGFFQRVRLFTGWPLLLGYFLVPWLTWDGRQAVWFDLPQRQFHILGLTLLPQDFPLLAFLLIIAAFSLFAVTVIAGRIWCGYTCPQTVWTSIFMWIEQKTEGSRNQRIRLDAAPWSASKVVKKSAKHLGWLGIALLTGMTFVGYFYPIRELAVELATFSPGKWQGLWTLFFTLATYINAGWMREQVCIYMCPYARFQSVMFDKDTLIVSYDPGRGEPRGSRKRSADPKSLGLGDCIDCNLCVQVCPTGIDIRNGLQYQCIGCALCIDACNSVMAKMEYPQGLIRYTSENALEGKSRHWLRPRAIGYVLVVAVMLGAFAWKLATRHPLEMTAIRDRNQLYVEMPDGRIANAFTLRIVNLDQKRHELRLEVDGLPPSAKLESDPFYTIAPGEPSMIAVRISLPRDDLDSPNETFLFTASSVGDDGAYVEAETRFMGPR